MNEYILQGLDCVNCAALVEQAIKKSEGVQNASINFVKGSVKVEWRQDFAGDKLRTLDEIIKSVEGGIKISEKGTRAGGGGAAVDRLLIIRLVIGAVVFAAGLVLEHAFSVDKYIYLAAFIAGVVMLGIDVLGRAAKNIIRGKVFDENFLMSIATIGAFAIGEYAEAVGVMLFYQVGEMFQGLAVRRAKRSISSLMDIRPDFANILSDEGELVRVGAETVAIGQQIVVKAGERVPLDGEVIEGESMLDTAALTGESVPVRVRAGERVLSGSVNQSGMLTIRVTQVFGESTASKIIDLVENAAEKKAPTESFITKFARYYTPAVVVLAVLIAVLPPLFMQAGGAIWMDWIRRGLIMLVISCPCALVISIPLGFFGGIGGASRKGVLIKGGNYLEALNHVDIVVFDKTGTLTKGVFSVSEVMPSINTTREQLLQAAAMAEAFSNHPIALSIMRESVGEIDKNSLKDYTEIAGHGISVKTALNELILAGNEKLMHSRNIDFVQNNSVGTKVYVAKNDIFMGCIVIADQIKEDAKTIVQLLKKRQVRVVMLTGDNSLIANEVAKQVGIDEVYAELLPEQKVQKVEWLNSQKKKDKKLVFMGDGINDAPVLALSDIGICMGGLGSDAAIEAADVVIMNDEPTKLVDAISTARFTRRIVWQNIIFALAVKVVFLLLGALNLATMWAAVFADVGVAVGAVINSLRSLNAVSYGA